jgi:hypothetical protein
VIDAVAGGQLQSTGTLANVGGSAARRPGSGHPRHRR